MLKLVGHKKDVRGVAFAPDGRLVSCGSDKTVRVWNPLSGECFTTIKTGTVTYAIAVSGDRIAFAGRPAPRATSNFVRVCDFAGQLTERYEVRTSRLASRFDLVTRTYLPPVTEPVARTVWSLSFSADGRYLAAAVRKPGGGNQPDGAGGSTGTSVPEERSRRSPVTTFMRSSSPRLETESR